MAVKIVHMSYIGWYRCVGC